MASGRVWPVAGRALPVLVVLAAVLVPARAGMPAVGPRLRPDSVLAPGTRGRTGTFAVASGVLERGRERTFVLHVPPGLLAPAPLLLALHGFTQDAERLRRTTGLEGLADRDGFVVAFPEGVDDAWNAGRCCGRARALGVDDVRYLDAVVATVRAVAPVDPHRLALTGFSNGGMMALRYACERASQVSAVAVVAGTVVTPCAPDAPVAVLDLHGVADRTVPLAGGRVPRLRTVFSPVRDALRPFAEAGGEVEVVPVPGAAHGWMRGATRAVWDWLRDHPPTGAPAEAPAGPSPGPSSLAAPSPGPR